jgi:hypothetical protein
MGIASLPPNHLRERTARAARSQLSRLGSLSLDVSRLEVRPVNAGSVEGVRTVGVAAADAGLVSIELAPFSLEFLFVADDQGATHLAELFPLSVLADDLEEIFSRTPVLNEFAANLGTSWRDLSDMWQRQLEEERLFPRDVKLVADTLRELAEWAVCMELALRLPKSPPQAGLAGLVLHDGLLRSILLRQRIISEALPRWWESAWRERGVMIAGVGKSSMVVDQIGTSLMMDDRVTELKNCYIPVPPDFELKLSGRISNGPRMGFGNLFLLKSDSGAAGGFLPVDLPSWITHDRRTCDATMEEILRVSRGSFPRSGYPAPLGKAHEAAHLTEFDAKVIRDRLLDELRKLMPPEDFEKTVRTWAFPQEKWAKVGRIGKT